MLSGALRRRIPTECDGIADKVHLTGESETKERRGLAERVSEVSALLACGMLRS